ncbi:hypothetical protein QBC35DRAFT_541800 [Podospora australis]|uniref:Uncharacterized protein n=1 Tax=Podospora australis TaxID=1536484 RepID=A0AAN6WM69_9PEZI|nr:hypothetical protein QBC35DRAFT_541800 [Podospora australis]
MTHFHSPEFYHQLRHENYNRSQEPIVDLTKVNQFEVYIPFSVIWTSRDHLRPEDAEDYNCKCRDKAHAVFHDDWDNHADIMHKFIPQIDLVMKRLAEVIVYGKNGPNTTEVKATKFFQDWQLQNCKVEAHEHKAAKGKNLCSAPFRIDGVRVVLERTKESWVPKSETRPPLEVNLWLIDNGVIASTTMHPQQFDEWTPVVQRYWAKTDQTHFVSVDRVMGVGYAALA